jgi:hypothetical protein
MAPGLIRGLMVATTTGIRCSFDRRDGLKLIEPRHAKRSLHRQAAGVIASEPDRQVDELRPPSASADTSGWVASWWRQRRSIRSGSITSTSPTPMRS